MVHTRASQEFERDHPQYAALQRRDLEQVKRLCAAAPGAAAATGPGGINLLHACAMLNYAGAIPCLVDAGAAVEAQLSHSPGSPLVHPWILRARLRAGKTQSWLLWAIPAGSTPLAVAATLGSRQAVVALLDAGADVQPVLHGAVLTLDTFTWLLPELAQRYAADGLELDAGRLGTLTSRAAACLPDTCLFILEAASARGLTLEDADAARVLYHAVSKGHLGLVRHVLGSGVNLTADPFTLWALPRLAANYGRADILELLLGGGAPVNGDLLWAVFAALSPPLLGVLLRHGLPPVDPAVPFHPPVLNPWDVKRWACPVLHLLQVNALRADRPHLPLLTRRPLVMAEMMAAAGLHPTVFRNVVLPPATEPLLEYDPIRAEAASFRLDNHNRYLWLVLNHERWSSSTHSRHPPALKAAVRTVLLMAGRGGMGGGRQGRRALPRRRGVAGRGCACEEGCRLLAALPQDVLFHIVELAARPLSAWVEEDAR